MKPYITMKEAEERAGKQGNTGRGYRLLTEENGCVAGCCSGITIYDETQYGKGGVHEDQEGFFVLEGDGYALIGEEEFEVHPGTSFLAPAGVRHCIRRNEDSCPVKVLYFHSAI